MDVSGEDTAVAKWLSDWWTEHKCRICKNYNSKRCNGLTHNISCKNFEKKDICSSK